ncbi:hypothetical protein B0H19DRAFT_1257527 [Mycena capillaripes]|nr:hypothetical protein B0H19DRAFT_1257527 [Mycena capillaripes]
MTTLGPQHLSANALIGSKSDDSKEIKVPEHFRAALAEAEERYEITVGMKSSSTPEKMINVYYVKACEALKPFVSQKAEVAHIRPIYNIFARLCNHFIQFEAQHNIPRPSIVNDIIECNALMSRIRKDKGARDEAAKANQHRTELEVARDNVKKTKKVAATVNKKKPKKNMSSATVNSDIEAIDAAVPDTDEDDEMEGVEESSKKEQPTAEPIVIDEEVVVTTPTPKKVLPKFNKNTARAVSVRLPYIHLPRINRNSNSYIKAMGVISKTNPAEASSVAAIPNTEGQSTRKKRNRNALVHEEHLPSTNTDEPPAKQQKHVAEADINHVRNLVAHANNIPMTDNALLCQEYNIRTKLHVLMHKMALYLDTRDTLTTEHERLLDLIDERSLEPTESEPQEFIMCAFYADTTPLFSGPSL